MCVYFWSDTDREKAENAIVQIIDIIDKAFELPEPFVLARANEIRKALSVRGLYDYSTSDRLNALLSNPQQFQEELLRYVSKERQLIKTEGKVGIGDITPVLTDMDTIKMMRFGMLGYNSMLYNTRSEEMALKPTWKGLLTNNRCVITTTQYIEFYKNTRTKTKTPYLFWLPGRKKIYLAGLWRQEESMFKRFTILTRQAEGDVEKIHDRMPVILDADQADAWMRQGLAPFGNAIYEHADTKVEYEEYNEAG